MVKKERILFSDKGILHAIKKNRFGAVIEVTNGLYNNSKRQEKKIQLKKAKRLLEESVGDDVQIVGGLALIKTGSGVKGINELDFRIHISDYNSTTLAFAVNEVLSGKVLPENHKRYLDSLVEYVERTRRCGLRQILNPTGRVFSNIGLVNGKSYNFYIPQIKGAVLEMYVKRVFRRVLPHNKNQRLVTELRMRENKSYGDCAVVDLLIATGRGDFRNALETLEQKYAQKSYRITVSYPTSDWLR